MKEHWLRRGGGFLQRSVDTQRCRNGNMGLTANSDSVVAKYLRRERGGTPSSWFERDAVPIPFQIKITILGFVCEVKGKEERMATCSEDYMNGVHRIQSSKVTAWENSSGPFIVRGLRNERGMSGQLIDGNFLRRVRCVSYHSSNALTKTGPHLLAWRIRYWRTQMRG